jgi:hypothetical protein
VAAITDSVAARLLGREEGGQDIGRPQREEHTGSAAGNTEKEALGEELSQQAAARCTERQADRDLACARRCPREEQIRDVGAGNEKDEAHGRHEHGPERDDHPAKRRMDSRVEEQRHPARTLWVLERSHIRLGIRAREIGRDRVELCLCRFDARSISKARDH